MRRKGKRGRGVVGHYLVAAVYKQTGLSKTISQVLTSHSDTFMIRLFPFERFIEPLTSKAAFNLPRPGRGRRSLRKRKVGVPKGSSAL